MSPSTAGPDTTCHARARGGWQALWQFERLWLLLVLAIVLCRIAYVGPYRNGPEIRSDGVGYHAWTRAIVERDFSFCGWKPDRTGMLSFEDPSRGICQNKYPPGLALLRLPVMVFALDLSVRPPQISSAEHLTSSALSALALWCAMALCAWTLALLRVSPGRANAVLLVTLFGTGLFHYGTYDGSFTHVYSAMFCALLCSLAVREAVDGRPIPITAVFLSAFFLLAIRMTNAFLLAGLAGSYFVWKRRALTRKEWLRAATLALGASVALGLQVAYNYYVHGVLTINSYGNEAFLWHRPMQRAVLLSYERGLLTYQPIFGLSALCALACAGARAWGLLLIALIAVYVTLYGYWHSWMLGGGMGHRGFVELAPIVAIALGLALRDRNARWLAGVTVMATLCTMVTLSVMLGYWAGTFPFAGASRARYWNHVLGSEPEALTE